MNVDIKYTILTSHTIFFDCICDEVERMYGMRTLVANI